MIVQMKRCNCPACQKPLVVAAQQSAESFACPNCKRKVVFSSSRLELVDERARTTNTPRGRVKPVVPAIPLVAPSHGIPATPAASKDAGKVAPPFLPAAISGQRRSGATARNRFVIGGVALLAGFVAMYLVVAVLSHTPAPSDNESTSTGASLSASSLELRNPQLPQSIQPAAPPRSTTEPLRELNRPRVTTPPPTAANAASATDPIGMVLESVAVVSIGDEGHGSGFIAAPNVLVTNCHVIEDGLIPDIRITFPDNPSRLGRPLGVELLHEDAENDLAFLLVQTDVRPLQIDKAYEHNNGQQIVAIGSPGTGAAGHTLENLTTDGRLGPEVHMDDGIVRWALSMPVNAGNSGGPVVDARSGHVLGVIVAKFTETEAQSLAIPHAVLARELAEAQAATAEQREVALSRHRQRYCLRRMVQVLVATSISFDRSVAAALKRSAEGGKAMNAAFNECKSKHAEIFAEKFAHFTSTVGAEVELLQHDEHCDPAVRRGLIKLRADIEKQADDIREWVPGDEIEGFRGKFRASLRGSVALIKSLASRLAVADPVEEE